MVPHAGSASHRADRAGAVVIVVVAPEHIGVERGPVGVAGRAATARIESVTGGSQTDQRAATIEIIVQILHLVGGKGPSTRVDNHKVGLGKDFHARDLVPVGAALFGASLDDLAGEIVFELQFTGETGQGLGGKVLILGREEDHQRPPVFSESKRRLARQVRRGNRGTDVPLDVAHHEIDSREVIHLGRHGRIVHRIGQVAHQHDVLAEPREVAQPEGPAEHAHVRVHTHQDDVLDLPLFEQVPYLDAGVADGVTVPDLDRVDLPGPGQRFRTLGLAIASAVGMIDRIARPLLGLVLPVAPFGDAVRQIGRPRRVPGDPAPGAVPVMLHGVTGGVDDKNALLPCDGHDAIHHRRQLRDTPRCALAPVAVPHIADDDCGLGRIPLRSPAHDAEAAQVIGQRDARAEMHLKCCILCLGLSQTAEQLAGNENPEKQHAGRGFELERLHKRHSRGLVVIVEESISGRSSRHRRRRSGP